MIGVDEYNPLLCDYIQRAIVEYYYRLLPDELLEQYHDHIGNCESCAFALSEVHKQHDDSDPCHRIFFKDPVYGLPERPERLPNTPPAIPAFTRLPRLFMSRSFRLFPVKPGPVVYTPGPQIAISDVPQFFILTA